VPPGQVTINSVDPPLSVAGWLGEEQPTVTSGYGGWTVVSRPRRYGLTDFVGLDPKRLSFSLLIDGLAAGRSVETEVRNLERMASIDAGRKTPSIVTVSGPLPWSTLQWVIEELSFNESTWSEGGDRIRQKITITLLQFVEDVRLKKLAAKKATSSTPYVVKAGEHLGEIAAKRLGDASRWKEIAELNDLRTPRDVKKGQRLRMPVK